jgi:hypothetical protein
MMFNTIPFTPPLSELYQTISLFKFSTRELRRLLAPPHQLKASTAMPLTLLLSILLLKLFWLRALRIRPSVYGICVT